MSLIILREIENFHEFKRIKNYRIKSKPDLNFYFKKENLEHMKTTKFMK